MSRRLAAAAAWLLVVGWSVAYLLTGRLSDDGLHAYAGRAVLRGWRLYTDFAYHQGPMLPTALAGWYRCAGVGFVQARGLAAGLAVLAVLLTWRVAVRAGAGQNAWRPVLLALAACPSLMLHLGYVQPHGLATVLALAAAWCLVAGDGDLTPPPPLRPRRGGVEPGLLRADSPSPRAERGLGGEVAVALPAALLLAAAAATRISFAALLLPFAWHLRQRRAALLVLVSAWLLALAALYGPYVARGGLLDVLYLPFGGGGNALTRYTAALYPVAGRLASWPNQLVYYAPLWVLVVAATATRRSGSPLLVQTALLLTIVHGVLPQRVNHSYLAVAMPFWAAWVATVAPPVGRRTWQLALVLAMVPATVRGVSRLDLDGPGPALGRVQTAARRLAQFTAPDRPVLTFAAEVATAADRDVLLGFELGYFAYYPNMPEDVARRCHVINPAALLTLLQERRAETLLLHAGAFAPLGRTSAAWPDAGGLWAAVRDGYEPVDAWPHVGEKAGGMVLWRRQRHADEEGAPAPRPIPSGNR